MDHTIDQFDLKYYILIKPDFFRYVFFKIRSQMTLDY